MTSRTAAAPLHDAEVITLVGFAHGVSHFFQLVIPPLFPWLRQDFGLSFTAVGLLMTVFFVVSGVGQALAGFVVDRFGARPVLLGGVGLLCASGGLLAAAQNLPMLLLAAAVAGLGNCVFHPADFSMLNRQVSSARLGHAFSVHSVVGTLGWAAAPVFMFGIATTAGWRTAALAAGGLAFVALAALVLRRHALDPGFVARPAQREAAPGEGAFDFLRSREVWMCFAFFLSWTLAFGALQNFAPAVLGSLYSLPLSIATSSVTVYMLGSAAGSLAGGFLAQASAPDKAVAGAMSLAAFIALVLAGSAVPSAAVLPLMAVMGFAGGLSLPSRDLLVRKAAVAGAGAPSYGRIYGFVYSGLDTAMALAPLVFGRLLDASQFQQVLVGVALFQGLSILTALRVGKPSIGAARGL